MKLDRIKRAWLGLICCGPLLPFCFLAQYAIEIHRRDLALIFGFALLIDVMIVLILLAIKNKR